MKFKDLQKKETKDLQKVLGELREKLQDLRFKVANNQLKNIREIREVKKNISHTLFLLGQKNKPVSPEVKKEEVKSQEITKQKVK